MLTTTIYFATMGFTTIDSAKMEPATMGSVTMD